MDAIGQSIESVTDQAREVFTKKGPPNRKTGADNSYVHLDHPESRLDLSSYTRVQSQYTNHHTPLYAYSHVISGLGLISTVVFNLIILMAKTLYPTLALLPQDLFGWVHTVLLSSILRSH
jgi:hypothetical protein